MRQTQGLWLPGKTVGLLRFTIFVCFFLLQRMKEKSLGNHGGYCHLPNLCPAPLFLSNRTPVLFRAALCPGKELHFSASLEVQVDMGTSPSL